MTVFGDTEAADAYCADPAPPDPAQVARRFHDHRVYLERVAGRHLTDWHRLPDDHRRVAVALTAAVLDWLYAEGHFGP